MNRRNLESVMFVELLSAVMKRMDQQCSDASVEGHSDSAVDGILQQGRPQVHALGTSVHGESKENHYRNRIRHVAPHCARRHLVRDNTGCPDVE